MLKRIGTRVEMNEILDQELEILRSTSLYMDGRSGHPVRLYFTDDSSTKIDVRFYCVFTTKPHFFLLVGNPDNDLYTLYTWEVNINHEEIIQVVYQSVLASYPKLIGEYKLSIVTTICKVCYEEFSKFDAQVQEEIQEDCFTVTVIQDPHLLLQDEEYIEEVCKRSR
ncbi:hypothetical protein ACFVS2_26000 [Brevibacillus sp. NPDC058079]|uniref:hypothetical protein n=1 Tax=Brevibacillus sp. NPDC058079 TaxID=3346330 RepID=UPI0036EF37C2